MRVKLKIFNEIISWALLIAVSILLIFSIHNVLESKKTGEAAFVFGYRPVLVLSGSMEPYMMTNSLAITKQVNDINDLELGDVITYHLDTEEGERILITHRIMAIDNDRIYTKGDNNRVSDSVPLTIDNVEAEVVHVFNQTAWIAAKWQTPTGKVMLISGVAAIILLYFSIKLWVSWFLSRHKKDEGAEVISGDSNSLFENREVPDSDNGPQAKDQ